MAVADEQRDHLQRHPLSRGFSWLPRAAPPRRLSVSEQDQFNRDGYVVLREVFGPEEIAAVRSAIDPFEAGETERLKARGGRQSISDAEAITFTVHLVTRCGALRAFAAHPAIRDICHDLLGEAVRLYWDQAVHKKPDQQREFPWHQDNGYTFVTPEQYLTLWIPLVEVDEANGCPWVVPGLHRTGTLKHWVTDVGLKCLDHPVGDVACPAKAGDVIAFSSLTPHRTGPNLTRRVREAYILQYCLDGSVATYPDGRQAEQNDPLRQFRVL